MATVNKMVEGSAAEEKTESPAVEKKEDAKTKAPATKGKRVSASQAKRLAEMLKGKSTKATVGKTPVDAEDVIDGGADEDKE